MGGCTADFSTREPASVAPPLSVCPPPTSVVCFCHGGARVLQLAGVKPERLELIQERGGGLAPGDRDARAIDPAAIPFLLPLSMLSTIFPPPPSNLTWKQGVRTENPA